MPGSRPAKYRNRAVYTTADGRYVGRGHPEAERKVFDSEKEFRHWLLLLARLESGQIDRLERQRRFPLHGPNGTKITVYVADFVFVENGSLVVVDVKSEITRKLATYRYKRDWMADEYGITIREV